MTQYLVGMLVVPVAFAMTCLLIWALSLLLKNDTSRVTDLGESVIFFTAFVLMLIIVALLGYIGFMNLRMI